MGTGVPRVPRGASSLAAVLIRKANALAPAEPTVPEALEKRRQELNLSIKEWCLILDVSQATYADVRYRRKAMPLWGLRRAVVTGIDPLVLLDIDIFPWRG